MNRLIDAIEALFAATVKSGGDLAKTANFTLQNLNWKETLDRPEPASHHIVDSYLEAACANAGPDGSDSQILAQTSPGEQGDGFTLFRVGDAISSRDIHCAILDSRRLCKDL